MRPGGWGRGGATKRVGQGAVRVGGMQGGRKRVGMGSANPGSCWLVSGMVGVRQVVGQRAAAEACSGLCGEQSAGPHRSVIW